MEEFRYGGLDVVADHTRPHVGGNMRVGDPHTYCPSVWSYMIDRFCLRSVLDLGSGSGHSSMWFHRRGMQVLAVDGAPENAENALYPTVVHDLTTGPLRTRVDFTHCQEVVEHIEEKYLDHVLDSMLCGRVILMTHALPGQDGFHHVNLQPPEYWIGHLTARGCALLEGDTCRVRALASQDQAPFMNRSGLVFINTRAARANP